MTARPPTQAELEAAISTLLGALPEGMEFRFYWLDGRQHLTMTRSDGSQQTLAVVRRADGVGIPTPITH
jgi:hypothetical protein